MVGIHPLFFIAIVLVYDLIAACGFWFFLTFLQSLSKSNRENSDPSQIRSKFPKKSLIIFASFLFFPASCSVNKTLRYTFTPDNMYFANSRIDNASHIVAFVILCFFLFLAYRFVYRQSS